MLNLATKLIAGLMAGLPADLAAGKVAPRFNLPQLQRRKEPRVRTEAEIAKHSAKMQRAYARWASGVMYNPCMTREQKNVLLLG
jgi:hypothetical protein